MNCIFSTLKSVSNLACSLGKPTIKIFDQSLFWKASTVIQNKANPLIMKIIVSLCTFHTVMNLLGAIGTIGENPGLSNVLETIYKENSVSHILKGKAVFRALRGHFIICQCLSTLIAEK